ncbi:SRPBCC family protein [Streptomyces montanisoli]|uniref:SRPBCC family protein n=1 Tax=Streptomyces montanisoli TaxID=2798581 RepID=A0A940MD78_9ACTN|nr:SRPBCC family protein [Streptomyces montanisoli]MBP0456543.1 SRPBCC family protein [Streptomyces montanisoli]
MVHVVRHIDVARPLPAVIAYLADFAHAVEWDPGTRECLRLDEGPVREGALWRNVSEFRGRSTTLTYRLDRMGSDRLTFVGTNDTATSTDDLTFTERGGRTGITYEATIVFNGLAKLAGPFLRREFERLGDGVTHTLPDAVAAAVGA